MTRPLFIVHLRSPEGWVERYFRTAAAAGRFLLTETARRALQIRTETRFPTVKDIERN